MGYNICENPRGNAKAGNDESNDFTRVVRDIGPVIRSKLGSIRLDDPMVGVDDLAQEVWINLYSKRGTWRVASIDVLDAIRKATHLAERLNSQRQRLLTNNRKAFEPPVRSVEDTVIDRVTIERVRGGLTEEDGVIVDLLALGESPKEIARIVFGDEKGVQRVGAALLRIKGQQEPHF